MECKDKILSTIILHRLNDILEASYPAFDRWTNTQLPDKELSRSLQLFASKRNEIQPCRQIRCMDSQLPLGKFLGINMIRFNKTSIDRIEFKNSISCVPYYIKGNI